MDLFSARRDAGIRTNSVARQIFQGAATGLLADAVVSQINPQLDQLISIEQRRREKQVREASAHDVAGVRIGEKALGRKLSDTEKRKAKLGFTIAYGIAWGVIYSIVRNGIPRSSRFIGLPFGIAFFFACDGVLAPLLKFSPPLPQIPWQPSAKELANHVAWTASAEISHRAAERIMPSRES